MCFMIFFNKETPHQTKKTRSSKGRKIGIFPKGLVHGFGQKLVIFPLFLKRQNRPNKSVLRYSRRKKRLSRLKKQEVFGFGQNMLIFADVYFRENRPEECVLNKKSVFYNIVQGSNAFLDYRKQEFEKVEKLGFFQRGLSVVLVKNW